MIINILKSNYYSHVSRSLNIQTYNLVYLYNYPEIVN